MNRMNVKKYASTFEQKIMTIKWHGVNVLVLSVVLFSGQSWTIRTLATMIIDSFDIRCKS